MVVNICVSREKQVLTSFWEEISISITLRPLLPPPLVYPASLFSHFWTWFVSGAVKGLECIFNFNEKVVKMRIFGSEKLSTSARIRFVSINLFCIPRDFKFPVCCFRWKTVDDSNVFQFLPKFQKDCCSNNYFVRFRLKFS